MRLRKDYYACILIICSLSFIAFASEQAVCGDGSKAEMIFSQSDGKSRELYVADFDGSDWSDAQQITSDNDDNVSPSLVIDSDGIKYLFWAAFGEEGIRVKFSRYINDEWTEAKELAPSLETSLTPSAVIDNDNRVWVVFCGNTGDDDDIYYVQFDADSEEQTLKIVNVENDAPDIEPTIILDDQEKLVVTWKAYRDDGYVHLMSGWDGNSWSEETAIESVDEDSSETADQSVSLPDYIDADSHVSLHVY